MTRSPAVQMGLFGGPTIEEPWHVVSAHTRLLPDGTETFVTEHLRWNRGRRGPHRPAPRPSLESASEQLGLFEPVVGPGSEGGSDES